MAVEQDQSLWAMVLGAFAGGSGIGALVTAFGHFLKNRASMSALVDARIRLLIDGYEKRITDMQREIEYLQKKIEELEKQKNCPSPGGFGI